MAVVKTAAEAVAKRITATISQDDDGGNGGEQDSDGNEEDDGGDGDNDDSDGDDSGDDNDQDN